MTQPLAIAIIGYGKIAHDQHIPAIAADPGYQLAATVSRRRAGPEGVPAFASVAELRASGLAIDAVALCNTPTERPAMAFEAIEAGWHLLLEKPPAAALGLVAQMEAAAMAQSLSIFASWHSRHAPAVTAARRFLAGRRIDALAIDWREDVRKWHPGQRWIWEAGGFGVFDPGINGLSIATSILPVELAVSSATLEIPANCQTPMVAEIRFTGPGVPEQSVARFDFLEQHGECWQIHVETEGRVLLLSEGGAKLAIDGVQQEVDGPGEYPALYRHFADLIASGTSDVDVRPLRIAADSFLLGERRTVAAFHDRA